MNIIRYMRIDIWKIRRVFVILHFITNAFRCILNAGNHLVDITAGYLIEMSEFNKNFLEIDKKV